MLRDAAPTVRVEDSTNVLGAAPQHEGEKHSARHPRGSSPAGPSASRDANATTFAKGRIAAAGNDGRGSSAHVGLRRRAVLTGIRVNPRPHNFRSRVNPEIS